MVYLKEMVCCRSMVAKIPGKRSLPLCVLGWEWPPKRATNDLSFVDTQQRKRRRAQRASEGEYIIEHYTTGPPLGPAHNNDILLEDHSTGPRPQRQLHDHFNHDKITPKPFEDDPRTTSDDGSALRRPRASESDSSSALRDQNVLWREGDHASRIRMGMGPEHSKAKLPPFHGKHANPTKRERVQLPISKS